MRLWVSAIALTLYGAVVFVTLFWPTPVDSGYRSAVQRLLKEAHERGLPAWFGYAQLEFAANIALFAPLGFFVALALPVGRRALAIPLCLLFSALAEGIQYAFMSARFGSLWDVLANTLGSAVGAAIAIATAALIHRRDQRMIARALWERRMA